MEASRPIYVHAEVGRQGKVVRLSSMKHREQIVQAEDAETRKSGQAFFMEASRPNHVQAEGAETRKSGEAVFKEASRTNHVQAEDAGTKKNGQVSSGKHREQISYRLGMGRQGKMVRLSSGKH